MPFMGFVSLPVMKLAGLEGAATWLQCKVLGKLINQINTQKEATLQLR